MLMNVIPRDMVCMPQLRIVTFSRGNSQESHLHTTQNALVRHPRSWEEWQDDLVNVSKFICECMDVMLGADTDDQSQTSAQP